MTKRVQWQRAKFPPDKDALVEVGEFDGNDGEPLRSLYWDTWEEQLWLKESLSTDTWYYADPLFNTIEVR